jgi:hypothetical protein
MKPTIQSIVSLFLAILVWAPESLAQEDSHADIVPQIYPGAIPSAPVFSLLGVNPEIVSRPSDIKEFKVDWRIKNYKIAPDLALEFQPLWWLYYRKKGLDSYQQASSFDKVLSSASLSFATAKMDGLNHMGMALKLNLYKEFDPYLDQRLQEDYELMEEEVIAPLQMELDSLLIELRITQDMELRKELLTTIEDKEAEIEHQRKYLMDEFQRMGVEFVREKWNMDMLDVAFGLVNKYDNGGLDSLKMRYAGYGIWMNGAKGLGKNSLLTGMLRLNRIGSNTDFLMGISYRYGTEKFNVFAELVLHRLGNNRANGFHENEIFGANLELDIGSGWYEFEEGEKQTLYTLSYGGDFRLSRNILLNFALRTQIKKGIGFDSFIPVANVVCLMN